MVSETLRYLCNQFHQAMNRNKYDTVAPLQPFQPRQPPTAEIHFFFNDWIITLYQCFIEIPSFILFQCLKCPLEKQRKQISTMGLSWEVKNRKGINKLPHIRHKFHYGQKTQT